MYPDSFLLIISNAYKSNLNLHNQMTTIIVFIHYLMLKDRLEYEYGDKISNKNVMARIYVFI